MILVSFISGLIFAIGLAVSGMTDPAKVIGFLDLFGEWDFALAFVMGGAVIFNVFSFKLLKNKKPLCSTQQFLPSKKVIDRNLVLGAILFGVGWGISGMCPGPALVNLVTFTPSSIIFVISMLVGMGIFKILEKRLTNS